MYCSEAVKTHVFVPVNTSILAVKLVVYVCVLQDIIIIIVYPGSTGPEVKNEGKD